MLEKVLKTANKYRNGSKYSRRLESDYAGNEDKLKEIASGMMDATNMVEESFKKIQSKIG